MIRTRSTQILATTADASATRRRGPALPAPRRRPARRGTTAVLAMLYLVIFSTLALGFYATVTTATQVAQNDVRAMNAQVMAESGMHFMKYQLASVRIPGTTPNDKVLEELYKSLSATKQLKPQSPNLDGREIGVAGDAIYVPNFAGDYFIPLDDGGAGFRASVVDVGDGSVLVKVIGRYRGANFSRAVELGFVSVPLNSTIFDYGIVTRGPINMHGNPSITGPENPAHANILSTYRNPTQTTMSGRASIGGELHLVDPNAAVSLGNSSSIAGSSNTAIRDSHIKRGVQEPEFPTVDTSVFLKYATNRYQPGLKTYVNTLVPAGTNPSFSGGVTIEGVLYIKHPNRVSFSGQATIRGVIVVENGAAPSPSNEIKFAGGVTQYGIETLPANDPRFPPDLLALQGSALLAPGYAVTMTGNSASLGGTIVADSFKLGGTSGAKIDGTIISMSTGPFEMHGTADIVRRPGKVPLPAGLYFPKTFKPVADTYLEVRATARNDRSVPTVVVAMAPGRGGAGAVEVASAWPGATPATFGTGQQSWWAGTTSQR